MAKESYEYVETEGKPLKMWTKGVQVEKEAEAQLRNVAQLPFIFKHLAVMPDVHWGIGATVGSVIATHRAIIPAAVGVDIGCGMVAICTDLYAKDLPDNLAAMRTAIEAAVPHGRTNNGREGDRGAWHNVPKAIEAQFDYGLTASLQFRLKHLADCTPILERAVARAPHHLGTLGTGNHFIEGCLDEHQRFWIMLHSGSRGIGNAIGLYFIEKAKEHMQKWHIHLLDADLAYLPEHVEDFDAYVKAVQLAQDFAFANRQAMLAATIDAIQFCLGRSFKFRMVAINCHHNYVSRERHFGENVIVTRKGAVSAQAGQLGIIPGSMGTRSYIVRGKGNADSFHSCSHGAGRTMSRTAAKKQFTLEDHIKATEGVECRKDADVIDETPMAYKDIDAVMAAQTDLVDIVHVLKQVLCVKG